MASLCMTPSKRTICRYCGVATDTGGSHSCERECLDALAAEVTKAKRLLSDAKNAPWPGPPGSRRAGD